MAKQITAAMALRWIRILAAIAEHPNTPPEEADGARRALSVWRRRLEELGMPSDPGEDPEDCREAVVSQSFTLLFEPWSGAMNALFDLAANRVQTRYAKGAPDMARFRRFLGSHIGLGNELMVYGDERGVPTGLFPRLLVDRFIKEAILGLHNAWGLARDYLDMPVLGGYDEGEGNAALVGNGSVYYEMVLVTCSDDAWMREPLAVLEFGSERQYRAIPFRAELERFIEFAQVKIQMLEAELRWRRGDLDGDLDMCLPALHPAWGKGALGMDMGCLDAIEVSAE